MYYTLSVNFNDETFICKNFKTMFKCGEWAQFIVETTQNWTELSIMDSNYNIIVSW